MEIKKSNQEEEKQEVEVPNIIGMTENEAKKALEEIGLLLEVKEEETVEEENNEQIKKITKQLPEAGIKIKQGTTIMAYK